jgi:predicted DNA-binding antitoxin AbrB/MazE fold protein
VEDAVALASAREDAEDLVQKVTLPEGELVEVLQALEVAEEKFYSLTDTSADVAQRLVVFEMEHQEQFEELSPL